MQKIFIVMITMYYYWITAVLEKVQGREAKKKCWTTCNLYTTNLKSNTMRVT